MSDPRPKVRSSDAGHVIDGVRCPSCGYGTVLPTRRCPMCAQQTVPCTMGPEGTIWSHTVVRIPFNGRMPPYPIAYVDLDDGARLLAHLPASAIESPVGVGDRVVLSGHTEAGDALVAIKEGRP